MKRAEVTKGRWLDSKQKAKSNGLKVMKSLYVKIKWKAEAKIQCNKYREHLWCFLYMM